MALFGQRLSKCYALLVSTQTQEMNEAMLDMLLGHVCVYTVLRDLKLFFHLFSHLFSSRTQSAHLRIHHNSDQAIYLPTKLKNSSSARSAHTDLIQIKLRAIINSKVADLVDLLVQYLQPCVSKKQLSTSAAALRKCAPKNAKIISMHSTVKPAMAVWNGIRKRYWARHVHAAYLAIRYPNGQTKFPTG